MTVGREITTPSGSGMPRRLVNEHMTDNHVAEDMRPLIIDTVNDNDDTPTFTPQSGSPAMMVTPPGVSTFTMFSERKHQSSEITITPVVQRPRLRRHANTAPSGIVPMFPGAKPQFTPQPPRRAISSTTAHAFSRSGSRERRRPSKALPLTQVEMSKLGRTKTRSRMSRQKSKRNSGGRMGPKAKPLVWRMSSPPKAFELPPEIKPSFSGRDRVKVKLKSMEMIKVGFVNTEPRGLPSASASSIVNTPNVFYKRPASVKTETPPSPAGSSTPLGSGAPPRGSSPLKNAISPKRSSPSSSLKSAECSTSGTLFTRAKHFSLPLSPVAQCVPWRRSMVVQGPWRNRTPVPEESKPVYIPGPIQLEEKIFATPRRNTGANVEHLDDGSVPQAKRFSDLVVLDSITMYFEAFGVATEASDADKGEKCTKGYACCASATYSSAAPRWHSNHSGGDISVSKGIARRRIISNGFWSSGPSQTSVATAVKGQPKV
ncbi:hypothetical protein P171DRAFT_487530 [Karstenula rhodostoma CBS 690.94]|uniref:Uncharacterized protein n=1 Tax=Karstenula rhodostoma CBS 690.94 TaxID=1392251 RepID=A0A9P4U8G9_9PLEO|nr:hypothetical protein P171DRAFT_487530 [Karstenula rhodostoma CBS 690.94]